MEYIDGPSRYQALRSNPVGSTDPTGEYDEDFHFSVVYLLLRMKCWNEADADAVATASLEVDVTHDPIALGRKLILAHGNGNVETENQAAAELAKYHFPGSTPVQATRRDDPGSRDAARAALSQGNLKAAGEALHTYADSWAHEGFSAYWSAVNKRGFGIGLPVGHVEAGHNPDQPFRDVGKALDAAKHIYELIPSRCKCGFAVPWGDIEEQLAQAFTTRGLPDDESLPIDERNGDVEAREAAVSLARVRLEDQYAEQLSGRGPQD